MTINDLYLWGKKNNTLNLPIELIATICGKATTISKSTSCESNEIVVQLSNDETISNLEE